MESPHDVRHVANVVLAVLAVRLAIRIHRVRIGGRSLRKQGLGQDTIKVNHLQAALK